MEFFLSPSFGLSARGGGPSSSPIPVTTIYIYTDGSFTTHVPTSIATWAFVALTNPTDQNCSRMIESYGPVTLNRSSPLFFGATELTNNVGELTAIGMALTWLIYIIPSIPT
jgi:ribonuclease HI